MKFTRTISSISLQKNFYNPEKVRYDTILKVLAFLLVVLATFFLKINLMNKLNGKFDHNVRVKKSSSGKRVWNYPEPKNTSMNKFTGESIWKFYDFSNTTKTSPFSNLNRAKFSHFSSPEFKCTHKANELKCNRKYTNKNNTFFSNRTMLRGLDPNPKLTNKWARGAGQLRVYHKIRRYFSDENLAHESKAYSAF